MAKQTLCALDDLAPGTARRFDLGDHRIAVVRIDDDVYAIGDTCSHQNISLALVVMLRAVLPATHSATFAWAWKPGKDEFIPDVMVWAREDESGDARFTGVPALAVEVLSTNRSDDLFLKMAKYAAAEAAFADPGALGRTVHLSYADRPGEEYAREMIFDLVVHSWDLARGISVDDTVDPALVEAVYGQIEPETDLAASGLFDAPVPVPPDADEQTKLIAFTGRNP